MKPRLQALTIAWLIAAAPAATLAQKKSSPAPVAFVRSTAASGVTTAAAQVGARAPTPPGQAPARDAASSGQAAFDRVCKVCHGPEARGDAGPRLVPFSREYEELLGIVREGTGQMPPISVRELSDESVADIVAYLTSLSR